MNLQEIIYEYLVSRFQTTQKVSDYDFFVVAGDISNIVNIEQKKLDYWRDDVDQEDYPDLDDDFYGKSEIQVAQELGDRLHNSGYWEI
jgi:hypothetical protein